jgi:hypothetical protein
VDVWGAERKADLWYKVFGLRTLFHWANAPEGSERSTEFGERATEETPEPAAKG